MDSPKAFAGLIKKMSYRRRTSAPLSNVTFFLGAGFSKAWDSSFPVGNELFTLTHEEWHPNTRALREYLPLESCDPFDLTITPNLFKDTVYRLGMLKKYPAIRPRYIDDQNIEITERELRALIYEKFKKTAPLYYFNESTEKIDFESKLNLEQKTIRNLFNRLIRESDGSQGTSEGVRTHFVTTNYDFTIEAILDSCYHEDDTFHLYTYRGITPSQLSGKIPLTFIYDHWLTGNLLKINGGFEIFREQESWSIDYRKKTTKEIKNNPPQIMLPSREQDYLQPYFQAIFPKAVRLLQESNILVLVGYSLPEEDALLRLLLRQFAENTNDGNNKIVFYVDISTTEKQIEQISRVFPHAAEEKGLNVIPHSGSFSEWAKNVVKEM